MEDKGKVFSQRWKFFHWKPVTESGLGFQVKHCSVQNSKQFFSRNLEDSHLQGSYFLILSAIANSLFYSLGVRAWPCFCGRIGDDILLVWPLALVVDLLCNSRQTNLLCLTVFLCFCVLDHVLLHSKEFVISSPASFFSISVLSSKGPRCTKTAGTRQQTHLFRREKHRLTQNRPSPPMKFKEYIQYILLLVLCLLCLRALPKEMPRKKDSLSRIGSDSKTCCIILVIFPAANLVVAQAREPAHHGRPWLQQWQRGQRRGVFRFWRPQLYQRAMPSFTKDWYL